MWTNSDNVPDGIRLMEAHSMSNKSTAEIRAIQDTGRPEREQNYSAFSTDIRQNLVQTKI